MPRSDEQQAPPEPILELIDIIARAIVDDHLQELEAGQRRDQEEATD